MKYLLIATLSVLFFVGCSSDEETVTTVTPSITNTPQPAVEVSAQPPRIPSLEARD